MQGAGRKINKVKWTPDIIAWMESQCPLKEHGYKSVLEFTNVMNEKFGTDFSCYAVSSRACILKIQFGLCKSEKQVHGERAAKYRPVGSLSTKKGFVRIKVAEPNKWMQLQRYIWEQAHPGQSAEGKVVIFLDGDTRNFDVDNLECVTRGELCAMNNIGNNDNLTKEERLLLLDKARIKMAMSKLMGRNDYVLFQKKQLYAKIMANPDLREKFKAEQKAFYLKRMEKLRSNPELLAEWREKMRLQKSLRTKGGKQ